MGEERWISREMDKQRGEIEREEIEREERSRKRDRDRESMCGTTFDVTIKLRGGGHAGGDVDLYEIRLEIALQHNVKSKEFMTVGKDNRLSVYCTGGQQQLYYGTCNKQEGRPSSFQLTTQSDVCNAISPTS